jgi:hypothetical protein
MACGLGFLVNKRSEKDRCGRYIWNCDVAYLINLGFFPYFVKHPPYRRILSLCGIKVAIYCIMFDSSQKRHNYCLIDYVDRLKASPPTIAEVKKIWIYICTPPYTFMA